MRYPSSKQITRRRTLAAVSLLAVIALLLAQIGPAGSSIYASSRPVALPAASSFTRAAPIAQPFSDGSSGGLTIVLGEGGEQPQTAVTNTVASGEPLSAEETQALLDRLPPLTAEESDQQGFNLPPESLPPPTPSVVIEESFPPTGTASAPVVDSGPLEVLRYAPEGEINLAPFIQVTFNQPMVPLTTLEELSAADVPVKLTPDLPGVWKWIGTETLTFEYASEEIDRFPMASEFSAEIPAGTTSANGGVLAEAVRWSFTTPPPNMQVFYPSHSPQARDPLLFVAFDQRIDPAAVLETIIVTVGRDEYALRLASDAEVAADETVSQLAKDVGEGRWLAFRADEEFPADATVNVNIGPDTPSAEGPLTTESVQSFSFQTYAPLRVTDARCAWGGARCPPMSPFSINFNNPLDQDAFDPALVTVDPEIPGMIVRNYGQTLEVQGATSGRTSYRVTISGSIQDIFGQTLGKDDSFTFRTGDASPSLSGPSQPLITLDPSASTPVFTVYSVNYPRLHVRAYAVTPDDWQLWQAYLRDYWQETPPPPPGELVYEDTISVEGQADQLTETSIDLTPALGDRSTGQLVVIVDIPEPLFGNPDRSVVQSWVQITQLALDAFSDPSQLLVWATDLQNGEALQDVTVELYGSDKEGATKDDGTLLLDLPDSNGYLLVGAQGDDMAILPRYAWDYYGDSGWSKQIVRDQLSWFVFDDRQMYRPTEEVHLKGWLRRIGSGPNGDIGLVEGGPGSVRYQVTEPQGNTIADGVVDVNDLGGFDFSFTIPENTNLGYANIYFTANDVGDVNGTDSYYSFQIQEFRRPEFEVKVQPEGEGPYFLGDDAIVSVSAQYYAGGPLPGAETTWTVNSQPGSYSPPNWPDFVFGVWQPWWIYSYGYDVYGAAEYGRFSPGQGGLGQIYTGKTDAAGVHYLAMDFVESTEARPYTVQAEARVMDVNRQAWAANTSLLVHPSELYVGLRSPSTFVEQGDPLEIEVIVTDVDGAPVAERDVLVTAARMEWQYENDTWQEVEVDPQDCSVQSGNEAMTCTFNTDLGGEYRVSAEVRDDRERLNRSEFTRWVSGGGSAPARNVEQEQAQLIPDKESYAPGDVAQILVVSPFSPAEGLLTVTRDGFLTTERFSIEEGTATLSVPIADEHIPNLNIQVDLNGSAPRLDDQGNPAEGAPPRPAFATGALTLRIPPVSRTLTLEIAPEASALAPGSETTIDVVATDAAGEPVENAELAVVVVDEAVLALTGYRIANPLAVFYAERGSGMESVYSRSNIVLADPEMLANQMAFGLGGGGPEIAAAAAPAGEAMPMPTMAMDSAETDKLSRAVSEESQSVDAAIAVRSDFNPLAVFAPAVRTDAEGKARIEFTLPDNLTRYRVTVVAATERQFGQSEANITARLPLMVRPSAPRFLNFGDRFELPIVVQNQTEQALDVQVALQVSNLTLDNGQPEQAAQAGQLVTVPANDRVEVRFPAMTENAGTARFQVAVASGDLADAAMGELPVYTPATTEAFAVYGVVDEGAVAQPVAQPQNVFPQFGGLEISTSSTALSALTDAVLYLTSYPFECSEQISSRVLGVTSLRDVLTAFQAEGLPSPEALAAAMVRDITHLEGMQNLDGGWPIWEKGKESVPFYSISAAHALQQARVKDYAVADATLSAALGHLRNIEAFYPSWYSEITRDALSAYALYVRDLMGDTDTSKARALLDKKPLDEQSLEQIAWLWQVLSDDSASTAEVEAIRRYVDNQAVETAGAANFITSYGDDEYVMLHSNRRTDAIVLDAMINDDPKNELIPKVVNGLLAHRTNGAWNNTQENVFVLIALDRYFNTFENVTPDFVARMWLGDTYVAEHEFEGYSNEARQTTVPMSFLVEQEGVQDFIISKEGDGRLYYRLGLSYAPTDLELDPLDMGFVVQREYEAVDDPQDVQRDEDGVWRIKAGARVRVNLTMVATNRRYHVALVDPLPAGFEPINPALAVSESVPGANPSAAPYGWWWYFPWYEHQNLRDSRAEAFTSMLWDGVYTYSYVARATTPGEFVAPPAKAEEMYSPEVFGRSGSDRVVVE